MAIEVNVTSTLRTLVGAKSIQGDGATVGALLVDLEAKFPGFKEQISGDDGELHRFVNIYVNDEDIRYLSALETPLTGKDVVSILPALAGGA
jgi:molybdopterin converting factor small subunit